MKVTVSENYDEMSVAAGSFIVEFLNVCVRNTQLCFAAGDSPLGTFKYLVQASQQGRISFERASFISLDEWVGMNGVDEGSCRHTLDTHFFKPLGIAEDRIHFFNGRSPHLEAECHRINDYLARQGPLDLVLLGLGLNGHLGFNEPGTSFQALCHCSMLHTTTQERGKRYFGTQKYLSQGLTLGLKQIHDSRAVILVVSGREKARLVRKVLQAKPYEGIPATLLSRHPNCHLFLDREASSEM